MASSKTAKEQSALSAFRPTDQHGRPLAPGSAGSSKSSPTGKASPPFATPDGRPAGQGVTGGTYSPPNRLQGEEDGRPSPPGPHMQSRPQQIGSPQQRVDPSSIASDGLTPPAKAPSYRAGTGSIGNASKPFKLKG